MSDWRGAPGDKPITVSYDFSEVAKRLRDLPRKMAAKILRRATRRAANLVAQRARMKLGTKHVQTGLTMRNIIVKSKKSRNSLTVAFAVTVSNRNWEKKMSKRHEGQEIKKQIPPYVRAILIERGFLHAKRGTTVAKDPFMRPALFESQQEVLDTVRDEIAKGLVELTGGAA